MKKILLIIIGLFLLTDYAMSQDKKMLVSIGDIATFRLGQTGIYNVNMYKFIINPETQLELSATVYEGLAVGGTASLIFDKSNNLSNDKIQFGFGLGPIIGYYFFVHDIVVPYLTLSYTYKHHEIKEEDLINDISVISVERFHSLISTAGLNFMVLENFSIYFAYSFVFESYDIRSSYKVEKNGSFHTFGLGCKVFFEI